MINEITIGDAYSKFYNGKISEQLWQELTRGLTDMTPFHKRVLDIMLQDKNPNDDRAKLELASIISRVWNERPDLKNSLINAMKAGKFNAYGSERNISTIYDVMTLVNYTEQANPKDLEVRTARGLVKLFENDKLLVTCTTSYSASRKYYSDSHWCTASGVDGKYNGYLMFKNYTVNSMDGSAILLQFVIKENRQASYQVQLFAEDKETGQICDFSDKSVNDDGFRKAIFEQTEVDPYDIIQQFPTRDLYETTEDSVYNEEAYWSILAEEYLEKAHDALIRCVASDKMLELAKIYLNIKPSTKEEKNLANNIIRAAYIPLACGNIVIAIELTKYFNYYNLNSDLLDEDAKNYITRITMDDDEEYADSTALNALFLTNNKLGVIKIYPQAWDVGEYGNLVRFNTKEDWDDSLWTYINGMTGEKINIEGCIIDEYDTYVSIGDYDYGQTTVEYYVNKETCEVIDKEDAVGISLNEIKQMAIDCLRKLLK